MVRTLGPLNEREVANEPNVDFEEHELINFQLNWPQAFGGRRGCVLCVRQCSLNQVLSGFEKMSSSG